MSFRRMLAELVERAPGARGAIFCDFEGEFIDLVIRTPQPEGGTLSEYDMKVFGAQICAAWTTLREEAVHLGAGPLVDMRIACPGGTLLCRALPEGYYLVLLLARGAISGAAGFELARTAKEVASELI